MVSQVHPAAEAFPLLAGPDFDALVDDIKKKGVLQPPVFHRDVLLDGRNRVRACEQLGVDYDYEEWDGRGGSPTAYIASVNIQRRHLTFDQRCAAGVVLEKEFAKEAAARRKVGQRRGGKTAGRGRPKSNSSPVHAPGSYRRDRATTRQSEATEQAAREVGVSRTSIQKAKRLLDDKKTLNAVRAGKKTLGQVRREKKAETPDAIARNHPHVRWLAAVRKTSALLADMDKHRGTLKKVLAKENPELWLDSMAVIRDRAEQWISFFEGLKP